MSRRNPCSPAGSSYRLRSRENWNQADLHFPAPLKWSIFTTPASTCAIWPPNSIPGFASPETLSNGKTSWTRGRLNFGPFAALTGSYPELAEETEETQEIRGYLRMTLRR
jgi:hypothetical protein